MQNTVELMGGGTLGIHKMYNLTSELTTLMTTMVSSLSSAGESFVHENSLPVVLAFAPLSNKGFQQRDSCLPFSIVGFSWSDSHKRAESIQCSSNILLVHRIPVNTLPEKISGMFLKYTSVLPKSVKEISYLGLLGKCYVEFMLSLHAQMAYDALVGEELHYHARKR
jgi:hypothetical protein